MWFGYLVWKDSGNNSKESLWMNLRPVNILQVYGYYFFLGFWSYPYLIIDVI